MWCENCQHGHKPNTDGSCPCCGKPLGAPIEIPEKQITPEKEPEKTTGVTLEGMKNSTKESKAFHGIDETTYKTETSADSSTIVFTPDEKPKKKKGRKKKKKIEKIEGSE